MKGLYKIKVLQKETSLGVPMLAFVIDEVFNGTRIFIQEA